MFIKFSDSLRKILKRSKIEMKKLKHAFIGSEHVLLSILNDDNDISQKLKEYHITYEIFKNEIIKMVGIGKSNNNYFIYTPLLKRIIENAICDAKENNAKEVCIADIFLAILDEGEGIANRILNNLGVNIDEMYSSMIKDNTYKKGNQKLSITSCSIDLNKKCLDEDSDPLIGREEEVSQLINILLRRNKNNPILIGEAGVGKTAIVEELARRIVKGNVPEKLKNKKIFSLSMAKAVAGTKYRGEFEDKITKILKELENNNDLIVFIDEIHTIVGAGGAEGAIDASNILKPALARGKIKIIGATTIKEYKETILKDKALSRRFQKILVKENTVKETIEILTRLKPYYEEYHNVRISDDLIIDLVKLTDKYITLERNPDKSLDILDTTLTRVSLKENKITNKLKKMVNELENIKKTKNNLIINGNYNDAYQYHLKEMNLDSIINKIKLNLKDEEKMEVTLSDIAKTIENKTNIPIYEVNKDYQKLKILAKYLNKNIIGQEEVIDKVTKITKKIFLGYKNNFPYSFLFLGKSGVGKTYLVKEYSKFLNMPLIRLDMSEYKEAHTISKIIGSPPGYVGYENSDTILEQIKNNPFCVILLDEVEKGCIDVINLFLQALDEGFITDSHGIKVNVSNAIIIMTSNIGYNKEQIGFEKNKQSESSIRNILSTAIVNRINTICYFKDLTKENIKNILKLHINKLRNKYKISNINFHINNKIIDDIIDKSEYFIYGSRKAIKILEDKIDDQVIDGILNGQNSIYIKG